jgi:hypothetical protein
MRLIVGILACLASTTLLADEPAAPAATPAPAATAPAADAPNSVLIPPPAAAAKTAAADEEAEVKRLRARGYRLEKRDGNEVWCRKEDTMGTRLGGHTVCRTAEQIRYEEEKVKRDVQRIQYNGPNKPAG